MTRAIVSVRGEPTELPRDAATALTIQNKSEGQAVHLAIADAAPERTAAGPVVGPRDWIRIADLAGDDKVWAWTDYEYAAAPVYVEQES